MVGVGLGLTPSEDVVGALIRDGSVTIFGNAVPSIVVMRTGIRDLYACPEIQKNKQLQQPSSNHLFGSRPVLIQDHRTTAIQGFSIQS